MNFSVNFELHFYLLKYLIQCMAPDLIKYYLIRTFKFSLPEIRSMAAAKSETVDFFIFKSSKFYHAAEMMQGKNLKTDTAKISRSPPVPPGAAAA